MSGSLKEKSERCWTLALELRENGDFNNCASRMYYAVFQAVKAYAVKKRGYDPNDKSTKVHNAMYHIVKEKMGTYYATYEDMREFRNTADYDQDDVPPGGITQHIVKQAEEIKKHFLDEADQ